MFPEHSHLMGGRGYGARVRAQCLQYEHTAGTSVVNVPESTSNMGGKALLPALFQCPSSLPGVSNTGLPGNEFASLLCCTVSG